MPTQTEASQSAVSVLDEALADLDLVRDCPDQLRQPGAAIAAPQTHIERAETRVDAIVAALRSLRIRVADLAP
jgi:hypothetical protein